jgi:hypothetical protein
MILDSPSVPSTLCFVARSSIANILFKRIDFVADLESDDIRVRVFFFMFELENCRKSAIGTLIVGVGGRRGGRKRVDGESVDNHWKRLPDHPMRF